MSLNLKDMIKIPALPENAKLICEIPGFERFVGYAIDTSGIVWSCKRNPEKWQELKSKKHKQSYPFVILSSFGTDKTITVHRLVGLSFLPNPDQLRDINHINGDKADNHVSNLEWMSHKDNVRHGIDNGFRNTATGERLANTFLTKCDVQDIYNRILAGEPNISIAKLYNIDRSLVSNIKRGKTWRSVTLL
jgi:hypothetical protein